MSALWSLLNCPSCAAEFDPFYAEWCECEGARTLVCPGCLACSCKAEGSWTEMKPVLRYTAPLALSNPRRAYCHSEAA